MKKLKALIGAGVLFAAAMCFISCGNAAGDGKAQDQRVCVPLTLGRADLTGQCPQHAAPSAETSGAPRCTLP